MLPSPGVPKLAPSVLGKLPYIIAAVQRQVLPHRPKRNAEGPAGLGAGRAQAPNVYPKRPIACMLASEMRFCFFSSLAQLVLSRAG